MSSRPAASVPVHPAVPAARRAYALFSLCALLFGVSMLLSGSTLLMCASPLLFGSVGYFAFRFYRLPQQGLTTRLHNMALQLALRGKDDEAIALLDQIPAEELVRGAIGVSVRTQRAMIAMRAGDVARALSLTSAGLAVPWARPPFTKQVEELHRTKARSFRAVCQASLGHEADAESDAVLAETSATVTPDVLARVSLARSIVLARRNDRPALAAHLQRTAGLMLQWLSPRERSLVRALRRMARAQTKNVYREPARREEASPGAFVSWVGTLAPGAEVYAREAPNGPSRADPAESEAPIEPNPASAVSNVRRAHASAGKKMRWVTVGLWAVLMGLFVGVYTVLSPSLASQPHRTRALHAHVEQMALSGWTLAALFVALLFVFVAVGVRIQRRQLRQLFRADLLVARGDLAGATLLMTPLTKANAYSVAATAHLGLARIAERGARWEDALAHCNDGLVRLLRYATAKAVHADLLLPELMATRAFVLATMGRQKEATAEMTVIKSDYPAYVGMGGAEFRVRLASAVRSGDLSAAMQVAMTRTPDLTLSIRDDVLADVILSVTTEMASEERERIEGELSDDAELGAWVDAMAPDLRRRGRARGGRVPGARVSVEPSGRGPAGDALEEPTEMEDGNDRRASRSAGLPS